jgi:hypothetical protein
MTETIGTASCCGSHKDWPQLTQHLVESFPDLPLVQIISVVTRTRAAERRFGLPESEHLAAAEIIVRRQLIQLTLDAASGAARPIRLP